MQRTFLTNLALVLVLNLLVKPFYIFGIDAEVQVRAGTEAYGLYAALLSLSFLLNILLDLGITNWNTRHIAQNTHAMQRHVSGILSVRALLAVGYAVVVGLGALVLGYRGQALELLGILVLNQVLAATVLYLRSNLAGAQRYAQDSLLSVMDRVLLIVLCGWLLWSGGITDFAFRIEWFAWAQTVAYGLTALTAFVLVRLRAGALSFGWDGAFSREVLRQSFPYALLVLLMSFYYRTDTVMLERMLPDGALQAGIYAQGFRFFEAFNMLGFLFAGLLLPMFSRMLKAGEDVGPLSGLALRLVLVGSLAIAVLGAFQALPVMELRYHEHTEESAPAFAVMIWSFVAVCITYVFGTLLTASGQLGLLNRMAAAGMVLNIGLNLWLIPRYQVLGAAWAGLITQGLTALAQVWIAARRYRFQVRPGPVWSVVAYLVGLVALGLASCWSGHSFGLLLLWFVPAAIALAVVTRALPLRELLHTLKADRRR
ncbi:MAG TPA: oligosaccharide flippase family protein [Flavobacteriales bacterium]